MVKTGAGVHPEKKDKGGEFFTLGRLKESHPYEIAPPEFHWAGPDEITPPEFHWASKPDE